MTDQGTLQEWNDEKGYGFITPDEKGRKVFAHIHDFRSSHPRPRNGDVVHFVVGKDSQGRSCAKKIQRPRIAKKASTWLFPKMVIISFFVWVGFQTANGVYPPDLPVGMVLLSLFSYIQYGADKKRAQSHQFRISEARLHFFDLLGGWPGGWIAQNRYNHKTQKNEFQAVFVLTLLIHAGCVFYLGTKPEIWKNTTYKPVVPRLIQEVERQIKQR